MDNQEKNRLFYERKYTNFSVDSILWKINNLEVFLNEAIKTDTSWFGLYKENFRNKIQGKKVLEMGCGDCTNAAIMAALGARVYANDIASSSGEIIKSLNSSYNFPYPITFIEGDFLKNSLPSAEFDFVVGKAFLHHLTIPVEKQFLKETARLLKNNGEARFLEPAVNSRLLDEVRWYTPVKGRPSKFQKKAFEVWKENDPHPDRSFSSAHWELAGKLFFKEVTTIPFGMLERFHRIIPQKELSVKFRRWALKNEKYFPALLNRTFSRTQVIVYKYPYPINQ